MASLYNKLMTTTDEMPLSKSMPKILRVAQEMEYGEFEKWIRLELHGYWNTNPALSEDVVVPEYRTVAGYFTDDYGRPLVISDPNLGFMNEIRLHFGVVELEGMTGAAGPLAFRAPDFSELIREHLKVEVTTFNFSPKTIPPVLEAIRTQLSDHLLFRKSKLVNETDESKVSQSEDIFELKPNIYGIGLNLKALWKKFQQRVRRDK